MEFLFSALSGLIVGFAIVFILLCLTFFITQEKK